MLQQNPIRRHSLPKISKIFVGLLLFIVNAAAISRAETPSDVDVSGNLEPRFESLKKDAENSRLLTGSAMLVFGLVAFVGAAATPIVTNLDKASSYPLIFGGIGALLTAGGFYVLAFPTETEDVSQEFLTRNDLSLESVKAKADQGVTNLKYLNDSAKRRKIVDGSLLVGAGLAHLIMTLDLTDQRISNLKVAGYGTSLGGLYALLSQRTLGLGGPLVAVGLSNIVTSMLDATAPSNDYLITTGTFLLASGVFRFLYQDPVEKSFEKYKEWQNTPHIAFNVVRGGCVIGLTQSF